MKNEAVGAKRMMSSAIDRGKEVAGREMWSSIVHVRTFAPVDSASSSMASAMCCRGRSRMMQTRSWGPMFRHVRTALRAPTANSGRILSRTLVGRMSAEELRHTQQSIAAVFIAAPRTDQHRVGRQGDDFLGHSTGVEVVATGHHQERNRAGADEVAVDREDEVTAEHVVPERCSDLVVKLGMGGLHLTCPLVEHGLELGAVVRGESNRILEHGRGHTI